MAIPLAIMGIKMAHLGNIKAFFGARQLNEPRADVTVLSLFSAHLLAPPFAPSSTVS